MSRHATYQDYIDFQKKKTEDPNRRSKWLGEEWDLKVNGFTEEFKRFSVLLRPDSKVLCLGARTGQEVVALKSLGITDVIGIDIVPHEPHVFYGDIHDLKYDGETFDFVYTNVLDHSLYPKKMVSEIERVLKQDGYALLQTQLGINQDEFTEFEFKNPLHDIVPLFEKSYCLHANYINSGKTSNFAGMNFEFVFQKDAVLDELHKKHGSFESIEVPEEYQRVWDEVNLEVQNQKLVDNKVPETEKTGLLDNLSKRAYYLTRLADAYGCKNIAEVGTAQGWQYYTFCVYASHMGGGCHVYSCDPRDVRPSSYVKKFDEDLRVGTFVNATSKEMAEVCKDVDFFYVDGLHDRGDVLRDVENLMKCQVEGKNSIWVFDDFDTRFGCFDDISRICQVSQRFKVVKIGKTASGNESHQAIVCARFM
jgi:SAM-dependent methyltransferase